MPALSRGTPTARRARRPRARLHPAHLSAPLRAQLEENNWRLAAAAAASLAVFFTTALSISFFMRPTRYYLFPLLSDIDAHHPESGILRAGAVVATLLLVGTTLAAAATVTVASSSSAADDSSAPLAANRGKTKGKGRTSKIDPAYVALSASPPPPQVDQAHQMSSCASDVDQVSPQSADVTAAALSPLPIPAPTAPNDILPTSPCPYGDDAGSSASSDSDSCVDVDDDDDDDDDDDAAVVCLRPPFPSPHHHHHKPPDSSSSATAATDADEPLLYLPDRQRSRERCDTRGARPATRRALRSLRRRLAVATRVNRRAMLLLVCAVAAIVALLVSGGLAKRAAGATLLDDDDPDGDAAAEGDAAAAAQAAAGGEARGQAAAGGEGSEAAPPMPQMGVYATVVLYATGVAWLMMLSFLTWFFLHLQATATALPSERSADVVSDEDPASAMSSSSVSSSVSIARDGAGSAAGVASGGTAQDDRTTAPSISYSSISLSLSSMSSSLASIPNVISSSVVALKAMDTDDMRAVVELRLRTLAWRAVATVRPICLTAQLVSVIKITGLLYALNFFSISKIYLIHTALLAALAFAEYTAAFFVFFFLVILAIDMRRASDDEHWGLRLKIGRAQTAPRGREYSQSKSQVSALANAV